MWIYLVATALLTLVAVAWFGGLVGASPVLSRRQAQKRLRALGDRVVEARAGRSTEAGSPRDSAHHGVSTTHVGFPPGQQDPGGRDAGSRSTFLDAAIPGALAFGAGALNWLTPDQAAIDAVAHVTGEQITNAFDLHATLAANRYQLFSEHSMAHWQGHVGEQQIAEQVESWAGTDAVDMPETANFAGADLSIFGDDYQVKFVNDFHNIDNIHGDTLIVPEDTANIPADALRVDFSAPFDPTMLEGHDVIVAEGITLAGAEDTWESAAGLAAGGMDAGDLGDAAELMAIPGLGAAIRVGMSGYRRRAALADPELRARASGRVARDATYGAAGVGVGGTIGTVLGSLIDVGTLGATGGGGAWAGGLIGAALGGKAGADAARARDDAELQKRRDKVNAAILDYGKAVEQKEAEAETAWTEATTAAETRAEQLAAARHSELEALTRLTCRDLEVLRRLSTAEASSLLNRAARSVTIAARGTSTPRGRRLTGEWIKRKDGLLAQGEDHEDLNVEEVLLLLVAAPEGELSVRRWLEQRLTRRTVVLATADHLHTALQRTAVLERTKLARELTTARTEIAAAAEMQLAKPIAKVERQTTELKEELKVNGYL